MAKGFKHGGSNPLNFKVICNPQPSTAKENTIWIDTDRINNYYFSAAQPENMVDYDVWISTGTSGPTAFNALKKNDIQVYPNGAMQCIAGAWVNKTSQIYQAGKWVDWWNGELYENGNEYTPVTGGWTLNGYYHTANPDKFIEAQLTDAHIYLLSESNKDCGVGTENPIDLSKYDTLTVSGEVLAIKNYNGTNYGLQVSVLSSKAVNTSIVTEKQINSVGKFNHSIDVSALPGKYYIIVRTAGLTGAEGKVTSVKLS